MSPEPAITAELESIPSDAAAIIAVAREAEAASTAPQELDHTKLNLVWRTDHRGGRHPEILDLERFDFWPRRKQGAATFRTAESFVAYVQAHAPTTDLEEPDGDVTLWGDVERAQIVAILNDHMRHQAGWGDHRATLDLRHPPSWKHWMGRNGQLGSQSSFAEHIEEGLLEIVDPPGADMLELAQTFQAKTQVSFRRAARLDSGQVQLTYHEEMEASAGQQGQIQIPPVFSLALQPFEGSEVYRVHARLRYRLRDGQLSIGYALERPDEVLRQAFGDVVKAVEAGTSIEVWQGTPRTA